MRHSAPIIRESSTPSVRRTIILHVVALAGLACGALTGAFLALDAGAAPREVERATGAVSSDTGLTSVDDRLDAFYRAEPRTCLLPGARPAGSPGCDV